jgi:hypothetical protein
MTKNRSTPNNILYSHTLTVSECGQCGRQENEPQPQVGEEVLEWLHFVVLQERFLD